MPRGRDLTACASHDYSIERSCLGAFRCEHDRGGTRRRLLWAGSTVHRPSWARFGDCIGLIVTE